MKHFANKLLNGLFSFHFHSDIATLMNVLIIFPFSLVSQSHSIPYFHFYMLSPPPNPVTQPSNPFPQFNKMDIKRNRLNDDSFGFPSVCPVLYPLTSILPTNCPLHRVHGVVWCHTIIHLPRFCDIFRFFTLLNSVVTEDWGREEEIGIGRANLYVLFTHFLTHPLILSRGLPIVFTVHQMLVLFLSVELFVFTKHAMEFHSGINVTFRSSWGGFVGRWRW